LLAYHTEFLTSAESSATGGVCRRWLGTTVLRIAVLKEMF
jgi:hypothetical protein